MGMGMGSRGRAGFRGDGRCASGGGGPGVSVDEGLGFRGGGRCASGGGGPGVSVDEGLGFRAVMPVYPNQEGSG